MHPAENTAIERPVRFVHVVEGMKPTNPTEMHKTWVLTFVVILTNVVGNLLLSCGMHQVGEIVSASPLDYLRAFANPSALIGICVLVFWTIAELALLSRADLSFVLPITASAYVVIAMCGHFVLDEQISRAQWIGIAVISLGAGVVGWTPPRTTQRPAEHHL